jgi:hypothetical protein
MHVVVNLYLYLLRDGVLHGSDWGLRPNTTALYRGYLSTAVANATAYVESEYWKQIQVSRTFA